MKRSTQQRFTLIELMIVAAIIGILSTVVQPDFQDCSRKAKVPEIVLATSAKQTCVKRVVKSRPTAPTNLSSCGTSTTTKYVGAVGAVPKVGIAVVTGWSDNSVLKATLTPHSVVGNSGP